MSEQKKQAKSVQQAEKHTQQTIQNKIQAQEINSTTNVQDSIKQQDKSKEPTKDFKKQVQIEQQLPDKFYDSDLASVNQKDFLSDNEPPKDIIHQRKRLHKQKNLHIYKTIIKVGLGIDKPAPYDEIKLRYRIQEITTKQGVEAARNAQFVGEREWVIYNLGKEYGELERLVTSMKKGEIAIFEVQWLEVSKKSNIKVLADKQVYVIEVQSWTTAIDIDGHGNVLKYLLRRGQGPYRVSLYNEIAYNLQIRYKDIEVVNQDVKNLKIQNEDIEEMWPVVWKVMSTMKKGELVSVRLSSWEMRAMNMSPIQMKEIEEDKDKQQPVSQKYNQLLALLKPKLPDDPIQLPSQLQSPSPQSPKSWQVILQIHDLINVDDIYMQGSILKKIIIKGVSTAKPQSSSLIYYALKFLDEDCKVLYEDKCFNSDWWEDFGKLDLLGCRKNYMDEFKMSKFLKATMKRMKPAEISEAECRNLAHFQYGHDYEQLKKLLEQKGKPFPPKRVHLLIRVYNFTEGKNCFNMTIDQKVQQSKRKKVIAIKLLNDGQLKKAHKRFQNIIAFYNSGDLNQNAYEEKISALMNSILCLMKENKYSEMIPLCNIVLEKPRHGFNQDKMQLKAQGIKVEGPVKNAEGEEMDSREAADLAQNDKITQKCLYRKALALVKIGESKKALECLENIKEQSQEVLGLRAEAEKKLQDYQEKTKKIFKSMFGA